MRNQYSRTTIWLGQKDKSIVLSMGDFGNVRANFVADIFENHQGYFCHLNSCMVELFGSEIEFLHRLTPDTRDMVINMYLSDAKKGELPSLN